LLDAGAQRHLLDEYCGAGELRESVAKLMRRLAEVDRDIALLQVAGRAVEKRSAELHAIVQELSSARLSVGEEELLEQESHRLEHAVDLRRLAGSSADMLAAEDSGVSHTVAVIKRNLDALVRIDPRAANMVELAASVEVSLAELERELLEYGERIDVDPERLAQVNDRRAVIFRLSRKYSESADGLVSLLERVRSELAATGVESERAEQLQRERDVLRDDLQRAAEKLTAVRQKGAKALSRLVSRMLPGLGLESGTLNVLVNAAVLSSSGADEVRMRVRLNAGHEERELARVASGGELSRIMLAIKTVLADSDKVPCLIFDEVDAGIGGETALRVGDALRALAGHHQVVVITHLPQIAARAHNHLIVRKLERGGVATTTVEAVEGSARVEEIARMMSGDPASAAGKRHARELLAAAEVAAHAP
jgi:DNA repair protein RecN (Recombination protein N)